MFPDEYLVLRLELVDELTKIVASGYGSFDGIDA